MTTSLPTRSSRFWRLLTTPPAFSPGERRLQTNLDTDFLKFVAIFSMLIDHIGGAFFPEAGIFRWAGRLAFPLFCYCLTVGLLYTRDIKKYLLRLALFAVVSQPFYVLAFHPHAFWENFTNWNIFFTLFLSLLAMYGWKERKWWIFLAAAFVACWFNFDYSGGGILLMLLFYLCRNRPKLGALLFCLSYVPALWNGSPLDPLALCVGPLAVDWSIFALLATPLIFVPTDTGLRVSKWVFYGFYPIHLAGIALMQAIL